MRGHTGWAVYSLFIHTADMTVVVFVAHRLLLCQVGRTQTSHRVGECPRVLPSK